MAGPHALLQMDSGELRGTPRLLNGIGQFIPEAELRVAATQSTKQSLQFFQMLEFDRDLLSMVSTEQLPGSPWLHLKTIVKHMKLNTGLNIPVQLVRTSLKTVHKKKMLTIKGKKYHVTDDFYLMIIKSESFITPLNAFIFTCFTLCKGAAVCRGGGEGQQNFFQEVEGGVLH